MARGEEYFTRWLPSFHLRMSFAVAFAARRLTVDRSTDTLFVSKIATQIATNLESARVRMRDAGERIGR
jgi:hypothetical protein